MHISLVPSHFPSRPSPTIPSACLQNNKPDSPSSRKNFRISISIHRAQSTTTTTTIATSLIPLTCPHATRNFPANLAKIGKKGHDIANEMPVIQPNEPQTATRIIRSPKSTVARHFVVRRFLRRSQHATTHTHITYEALDYGVPPTLQLCGGTSTGLEATDPIWYRTIHG